MGSHVYASSLLPGSRGYLDASAAAVLPPTLPTSQASRAPTYTQPQEEVRLDYEETHEVQVGPGAFVTRDELIRSTRGIFPEPPQLPQRPAYAAQSWGPSVPLSMRSGAFGMTAGGAASPTLPLPWGPSACGAEAGFEAVDSAASAGLLAAAVPRGACALASSSYASYASLAAGPGGAATAPLQLQVQRASFARQPERRSAASAPPAPPAAWESWNKPAMARPPARLSEEEVQAACVASEHTRAVQVALHRRLKALEELAASAQFLGTGEEALREVQRARPIRPGPPKDFGQAFLVEPLRGYFVDRSKVPWREAQLCGAGEEVPLSVRWLAGARSSPGLVMT